MTNPLAALARAEEHLRRAGIAFLAAHAEITGLKHRLAQCPEVANWISVRLSSSEAAQATPEDAAQHRAASPAVITPPSHGNAGASSRALHAGWTAEREALLRKLWADSAETDALLQALNALPGPALDQNKLRSKATVLKLGARGLAAPLNGRAPRQVAEADTSRVRLPASFTPRGHLTEARARLLLAMWPNPYFSLTTIRLTLQAAPGQPTTASDSMLYKWSRVLGLGYRNLEDQVPAAEIPPTLPPAPPLAAPTAPEPEPAAKAPPAPAAQHPPAPPVRAPELADAAVDRKQGEAKAMLFRGIPANIVAVQSGVNISVVLRLQGEVREARRLAAEGVAAE